VWNIVDDHEWDWEAQKGAESKVKYLIRESEWPCRCGDDQRPVDNEE